MNFTERVNTLWVYNILLPIVEMGVALLIYYYKGVDTGILTQVIGLCLSSKFLYIFFL